MSDLLRPARRPPGEASPITWFRVDDNFPDHPKVEEAEDLGSIGLWTLLGAWSSKHNTDGWVSYDLAVRKARGNERLVLDLIKVRLVDRGKGKHRGQVRVHDFLDKNPSRAEVEGDRARRKELRDPAIKKAVRLRDGDFCRYCAKEVDWNDRRSDAGGTYDHVIPDLASGVENIVVACRGCNSAKKNRTPTEAGMVLLPVPGPELRLRSVPEPDLDPDAENLSHLLNREGESRDGTGRDLKRTGRVAAGSGLDGPVPDGAARAGSGRAPAEGGTDRPPERVVAGSCPVHHVDLPCRVCAESGAVAL